MLWAARVYGERDYFRLIHDLFHRLAALIVGIHLLKSQSDTPAR